MSGSNDELLKDAVGNLVDSAAALAKIALNNIIDEEEKDEDDDKTQKDEE
jgi:hypothetical protein